MDRCIDQHIGIRSAWVTLAAVDFEGVVGFYERLLGVTAGIVVPDSYVEFQMPGGRLGIFRPGRDQEEEFTGAGGTVSFCLEVGDLETAIEGIQQLGGIVPGTVMVREYGREVYAYDPLGNRLILVEPLC